MQTLEIQVWIRVTLFTFLFLLFSTYSGQATDVTLEWTKPDDSRVAGYKIYYGEPGTDYKATPKMSVDTADQTNCLISGLQEGYVYGFVATSFDANGQQSVFSEDLFYSVPEKSLDSDGDGLTDGEETSIYGTDPNNTDTDGDGITDSDELSYWGQNWEADADNDGIINLIDPDSDNDGYMDGEEVGVSDPNDSNSVPASDSLLVIEVGELGVDHNWTTVAFSKNFLDPVVVAKPLSINGSNPSVIRLRNVTPAGFEIRIQEWDYLDGWHAMETVSFIAIERGTYVLENGSKLAADTFFANQTDSFQPFSFQESFGTAPIVISGIITENESDAVTGRIRNITAYGFEFSMQEQEANSPWHTEETVAVIAIEPSMGQIGTLLYEADKTGDQVTQDFHSIPFTQFFMAPPLFLADMQTTDGGDTANLRWANRTATSVDVQINEEKSKDSEINHTTEVVGYIVFSQLDPGDSNSVPASDSLPVIEAGELGVDHNWTTVVFSKNFLDPVVVAKPLSINGSNPSVIRLRNVTPAGFEIRIQEWDYLDGRHAMETVSFIAIERGTYVLENGSKLAADTFFANQTDSFQSFSFQESFGTAPIVMSGIITENESDAVTGRIQNITEFGFEFSMQEQEANSPWHTEETVAVIAIEPSMGQIGTLWYEADKTGDQVTHHFHSVTFDQFFTAPPLFLADMQTTDGGDTANLRWANKTASSVDVQINEEKSKDSEITHTNEVVGYIVFSQP